MTTEKSTEKKNWYKSPWVIGWLILLASVLAVNIYMIIQSMNQFPGLVVDDFYQRGQNYEENIHKKLKNNNLWKTSFDYGQIHLSQPTNIRFKITDKQGNKANIEKITLYLYRPSNSKKDFSQAMVATKEDNVWQTTVNFDSKGKWDILASVFVDGKEANYGESIFVNDENNQ